MSPTTATVYILGSGCPAPTPDRFGTSFAIKTGNDLIMVDCGPAATWKLAKAGLNPKDVTTVYLSHHHSDHNIDMPCLIHTRWDQRPDSGTPLRVVGPPPTVDFCDKLSGPNGAFQPDWNARCNWVRSLEVYEGRGGTLPRLPPAINATDIQPGWSWFSPDYKITAGYADHAQPYLECVAYRIDLPSGKSIVFSGDTGLCEEVIELATGADVFFCMSSGTSMNGEKDGSFTISECAKGASNPREAGIMAEKAGVKRLVLVHQGPGQALKTNWSVSIDAAKEEFAGEVIFGEELMKIEV